MKAQDWTSYEQEEFPAMAWEDMKDSVHPSIEEYDRKVAADYERTKKEFGFRSYGFDTEQGDHLSDFSKVIDSILSLLPEVCQYEKVGSYTDEASKRWAVDVHVNGQPYQFSTQAIGGIFMDMENLHSNLNKIIADHAPDYKIITLSFGQVAEILIERSDEIREASKKGFPYPLFRIEWKAPIPKGWYLYFPDCETGNEAELIAAYTQVFNELHKPAAPEKKLTPDNFHICDVEGNGLVYLYLNGRVIGTPAKFGRKMECGRHLPEFIFGYVLAERNGCKVLLVDKKKKRRRPVSPGELRAMIEKGI